MAGQGPQTPERHGIQHQPHQSGWEVRPTNLVRARPRPDAKPRYESGHAGGRTRPAVLQMAPTPPVTPSSDRDPSHDRGGFINIALLPVAEAMAGRAAWKPPFGALADPCRSIGSELVALLAAGDRHQRRAGLADILETFSTLCSSLATTHEVERLVEDWI
jgi:hypothetical protein